MAGELDDLEGLDAEGELQEAADSHPLYEEPDPEDLDGLGLGPEVEEDGLPSMAELLAEDEAREREAELLGTEESEEARGPSAPQPRWQPQAEPFRPQLSTEEEQRLQALRRRYPRMASG